MKKVAVILTLLSAMMITSCKEVKNTMSIPQNVKYTRQVTDLQIANYSDVCDDVLFTKDSIVMHTIEEIDIDSNDRENDGLDFGNVYAYYYKAIGSTKPFAPMGITCEWNSWLKDKVCSWDDTQYLCILKTAGDFFEVDCHSFDGQTAFAFLIAYEKNGSNDPVDFCVLDENTLLVLTTKNVMTFDVSGEMISEFEGDSCCFSNIDIYDENRCAIFYSNKSKQYVSLYNLQTNALTNKLEIPGIVRYADCDDKSVNVTVGKKVYSINSEFSAIELGMDFSKEEDVFSPVSVAVKNDNGYSMIMKSRIDNSYLQFDYSGTETVNHEKTKLTLYAYMNSEDYLPQNLVAAYNSVSNDYFVEVVELDEEINYKFETADAPDLIITGRNTLIDYGERGYLLDMRDIVENDLLIERETFTSAIYDLWNTDEKIYGIPRYFDIDSFDEYGIGSEKCDTFSVDDFLKEMQVINNSDSYCGFDKGLTFAVCFAGMFNRFVDTETGTAFFDSDVYRDLLSSIYEMNQPSVNDGDDRVDKFTFTEVNYAGFLSGSEYGPNNWCLRGYPTQDGKPIFYGYYDGIGIGSKCKNTDGAIDFVRYYLTYMYDELNMSISMVNSVNEQAIENAVRWNFTERTANSIDRAKKRELINQKMHILSDNTIMIPREYAQIGSIAVEEACDYFNGIRDIENVVYSTQNRAQLYLNEVK